MVGTERLLLKDGSNLCMMTDKVNHTSNW